MKTSALVVLTIFAGNIAFGQIAPADSKPAASTDNIKVAQAQAPAAAAPASKPVAATAESSAPADAAPSNSSPNSIEYVGADIQDVLRTLARQAGLNIVLGEDIQGKVTISLVDVTYEKAIKLIADSKGYAVIKEDNIIKVVSKASLAAEPLQEEIITLNYTTAAEAEKLLKPFLTQGRGTVFSDTRSNTLVVSDVPSKLKQLKEIVDRIDTATPQVMIEARILETIRNPKQDYGIKWESLVNYQVGAQNLGYKFSPINGSINSYKGGSASNPIKSADVAVLTASDFNLLISFLNSNGETDLLASPRVVTADNKEAKIAIAQQYPIPTFTFNQQTASLEVSGFEFKDIGILLGVTPHINKSGFITLELKPEVSNFDPTRNVSFGGTVQAQIPIINTRNLQASVLIKNGHTLALGGLVQEDTANSFTKVPIMGDIPGLGAAFRSKSFNKAKRNLLIFITPTVVDPSGSADVQAQLAAINKDPIGDYANSDPKVGWIDNAFPKGDQKSNATAAGQSK